jgi:TATA-box binding protein (TBP) (component of TFIID and TFIIIB)
MRWKDFSNTTRKKKLTRRQVHENVFVELDYIDEAMCSADPAAFAQVHNLVGTCQLKSSSRLNLETICRFLPNSVYEKQKFAAITIRLGSPQCTTLLFTSGKMVLTGCKSFIEVLLASMNCLYTLRMHLPGVQFELCDVAIQNIVGNADLRLAPDEFLDLDQFYKDMNVYSTFQRQMFPVRARPQGSARSCCAPARFAPAPARFAPRLTRPPAGPHLPPHRRRDRLSALLQRPHRPHRRPHHERRLRGLAQTVPAHQALPPDARTSTRYRFFSSFCFSRASRYCRSL